jgi:hypothetical protein
MLPWSTPTAPEPSEAPCLPVEMPCPPGSTPTIRTPRSRMKGQKRPIALDPPPTQATMRSGSRPIIRRDCARASSPMIRWKSRTSIGYGCGPITEPSR